MTAFVHYHSPLGTLLLAAEAEVLVGAWFLDQRHFPDTTGWRRSDGVVVLDEACRQLDAYFAGQRIRFQLPLAPAGTAYQHAVWAAIAAVPHGATTTYRDLAHRAGGGPRAAGAATGRNPLGILIPCHRVVASDGALTGYAGGLDRKRALLALEGGRPY